MSNGTVDIKELKERFNTLQQVIQSVKEEKIRTESEIKTLKTDYDEQLKNLLEVTGATTLEEATEIYNTRYSALEANKKKLEEELNGYLDTYGEPEGEI